MGKTLKNLIELLRSEFLVSIGLSISLIFTVMLYSTTAIQWYDKLLYGSMGFFLQISTLIFVRFTILYMKHNKHIARFSALCSISLIIVSCSANIVYTKKIIHTIKKDTQEETEQYKSYNKLLNDELLNKKSYNKSYNNSYNKIVQYENEIKQLTNKKNNEVSNKINTWSKAEVAKLYDIDLKNLNENLKEEQKLLKDHKNNLDEAKNNIKQYRNDIANTDRYIKNDTLDNDKIPYILGIIFELINLSLFIIKIYEKVKNDEFILLDEEIIKKKAILKEHDERANLLNDIISGLNDRITVLNNKAVELNEELNDNEKTLYDSKIEQSNNNHTINSYNNCTNNKSFNNRTINLNKKSNNKKIDRAINHSINKNENEYLQFIKKNIKNDNSIMTDNDVIEKTGWSKYKIQNQKKKLLKQNILTRKDKKSKKIYLAQ